MPRILQLAMLLAVMIGLAEGASAQPFFIAYLTPAGSTPTCDLSTTDPADFQDGNPAAQPNLPPTVLPLQSVSFDLCFIVWPVVDPGATETVCVNATGTPSCAEQVQFTTSGGISIVGFTPTPPEAGPPPNFPKYQAQTTSSSLLVAGGHPVAGQQGNGLTGIRLGTVTLQGVSPAGTFELTTTGGYVSAGGERKPVTNMILAATADSCGDNVLDPGEQCDDGNADFGDGCANCKTEDGFSLQGAVGTAGLLTVEIDSIPVTLDLSSLPGEPASEVVLILVANVNDAPGLGATAAQVDDPNQPLPNDGRRFVTDGVFTAEPTLTGSDGVLAVPEPGHLVLLAAGMALLVAIGRRRIRPRSGA